MSMTSNFQPMLSANRRYISYRSREQGRLVPSCPRPDLHDQRRVVGTRLAIVEQVAQRLAFRRLLLAQALELAHRVRPHLRVGLRRKERLSLGDLAAQVEIAAISHSHLGQRTALLGQGGDSRDVGRDLGVEQRPLDLQEPLVVGLQFLKHGAACS